MHPESKEPISSCALKDGPQVMLGSNFVLPVPTGTPTSLREPSAELGSPERLVLGFQGAPPWMPGSLGLRGAAASRLGRTKEQQHLLLAIVITTEAGGAA